ncbi:MAG: type IV pili methyl-accepting chemotaxis transducer N-terminal domain-containing protein [Pseudomonadota bacterium]
MNLAALQPMLAEQIAKSACFAALGQNISANRNYLAGAYRLFDRTRQGLRDGNDALGLKAESNQGMLSALASLDRAAELWAAQVDALGRTETVSEQLAFGIIAGSEAVVSKAADVAQMAEQVYATGDQAFPLAISLRIKLASRQRTLSQSMAKSFCMIAAGERAEEHRAVLSQSIALFEDSLTALIDGFPAFGLAPEANPAQRSQLQFVFGLWQEMKPAYTRIAAGGTPSAEELRLIAWQNNQILSQMNAAAFNYEFADPAS